MAEAYWHEASWKNHYGLKDQYRQYVRLALGAWNRIILELPEHDYHTPQAHYMSAECYRMLGQPARAIERYQAIVQNWPEHQYADLALGRVIKRLEDMVRAGTVTEGLGAAGLRKACQDILDYYPDRSMAPVAESVLTQLERSISVKGDSNE